MLSQRAQRLKPSPTLALAAKAKELKSKGHDVISLTVGEPDWDTFEGVKRAGIDSILKGETKYATANGLPELREAVAKQTNNDFGTDYKPSQVTVTTGGKFTLFSAMQMLLGAGDEVLIPAPYWVSYPTQVELAEATPVIVPTQSENRFLMTAKELSAVITPRTKMLILNSPSNPTGNMYDKASLQALAEVLRQHPKIWILSDDIYNRLVFIKGGLAPHLLQVAPDLRERVIVVNGVSKSYSMTGWRLGWALGPAQLIEAMNNYQSQTVSCVPTFVQRAAIEAIERGQVDLGPSLVTLKRRRDRAVELLSKIPGVRVTEPDGAFYLWPDIRTYLGKSWKGRVLSGSSEFSAALLESQMVAVVPGFEFGCEGYLRLSYALSEEKLQEAIARLGRFLNEF